MKEKEEFFISNLYIWIQIGFIAFIVFIAFKLLIVTLEFIQTGRKIQSLPGARIMLGNDSFDDYINQASNFVQQTGNRIHKVWMYFFCPVFSFNHHEVIKKALQDAFIRVNTFLGEWKLAKYWAGDSLLCMNNTEQCKRRRRLLEPAFSLEQIQCYMEKFNDSAEDLLIKLSKERYKSHVDITEPVCVAAIDVLLRCAYSYNGDLQEHGYNHPYVQAVHRLTVLHKKRLRNPLLSYDFVYHRTIHGKQFLSTCHFIQIFTENIVTRKIQSLIQGSEESLDPNHHVTDYLEALLYLKDEDGNELTYTQIKQEIEAFLCKGHYSLSSALVWCLYALAKHPDIQTKVYEEVFSVIGDREVEWNNLSKLQYLDCFIREVLRTCTIVPIIGRDLDKSVTIDNVQLRAGTHIQINIQAANHNPDVFGDSKVFRPERFCDNQLDDSDFLSFSSGPRSCLGKDLTMIILKVFISRILQTFQLELDPSHKISSTYFLSCQSKTGIKMFLYSR